MRSLVAALRFLTTLPLPGADQLRDGDWGRATAWYPAVGLVLGLLLAGLAWGLAWLFPGGLTAALLLVAWVVLTGALHLDGFVDCCDALLAPVARERRLEILRDVHVGAFGLTGGVLLLLVKYAALVVLADLDDPARLAGLLLVPTLARWTMTAALLRYPSARPESGLGRLARAGAGWRQLAIATVTAAAVALLAAWLGLGWLALGLVTVMALVAFLVARWIQARIGGLTGDACGAICELAEVAGLLALVAFSHLGIWP